MNKNYISQGAALILMSNATMFLGYLLKQALENGVFEWKRMLPCILVVMAGVIWNAWVLVNIQMGVGVLERELLDTQNRLTQALKKPTTPTTVISASAAPKERRKPSWRPN
jgi:hypothetical protein